MSWTASGLDSSACRPSDLMLLGTSPTDSLHATPAVVSPPYRRTLNTWKGHLHLHPHFGLNSGSLRCASSLHRSGLERVGRCPFDPCILFMS